MKTILVFGALAISLFLTGCGKPEIVTSTDNPSPFPPDPSDVGTYQLQIKDGHFIIFDTTTADLWISQDGTNWLMASNPIPAFNKQQIDDFTKRFLSTNAAARQ